MKIFNSSAAKTHISHTQVQLDIRTGHAQTVEKVLGWLDEEGGVRGTSVCDCGCGTGSLAIPLALRVGGSGSPVDWRQETPASLRMRHSHVCHESLGIRQHQHDTVACDCRRVSDLLCMIHVRHGDRGNLLSPREPITAMGAARGTEPAACEQDCAL